MANWYKLVKHLSRMENEKGDAFNMAVLLDALYGKEDGSELATACEDISCYTELKKWTNSDWTNLIKK